MEIYKKWELWIKTVTLGGVLVASIWAVYTYKDTKEKEYYSEFWNKKMELFLKTSNSASTMATATNVKDFNMARADYWELFYGELSLVEGPCVKRAMEVFSKCVPHYPLENKAALPIKNLLQPSYRLTVRLQKELANGWQEPFSELKLQELPEACDFKPEKKCE